MEISKKIAIIGNAGSGKSFLADQLGTLLKLPVYHLDQYFWKPHWTRPDPAEYKIIHETLCDKDTWIIDGINLKLLEYRIQKADIIIFLDIPWYHCFWNIFKRTWTYYGKETPSSAPGCKEGINSSFFTFLQWVLNFDKKHVRRIMELFIQYKASKKIFILKSQKEINLFLKNVSPFSIDY